MPRWSATRIASSVLVGSTIAVVTGYCWEHYVQPGSGSNIFSSGRRWLPGRSEPKHHALGDVATLFTKDVLVTAILDENSLDDVNKLLLKAFKEEAVLAALKDFFHEQFTENPVTTAALNDFLVKEVLGEEWVKKRLVGLAVEIGQELKKDKVIWEGSNPKTLTMLGDVSLDALRTERFKQEAIAALKVSVVKALSSSL